MRQFFCVILVLISCVCNAQITINEVMFSNKISAVDMFGLHPDWIELYNTTANTINLEGWQITDNPEKNTYWTFPKIHIEPYSFLLIFASGKDIYDTTELHTNFKIANLKESVFLYNPAGKKISSIPIQCVPRDFSIGYVHDGTGEISVLTPSPRISNTYSDIVEMDDYETSEIHFSHESGIYAQDFSLTLQSTDSLSEIYYTYTSEEPNEKHAVYQAPLLIQNRTSEPSLYATIKTSESWNKPQGDVYKATVIRAVTYRAGCPASKVYTKTYFIDSSIAKRYTVPIVSIVTDPDNLFDKDEGIYVYGNYNNYSQRGKAWEREAHFELFDTSQTLVLQQTIGLRIHGGASRAAPQKSLRLLAREEYGTPTFAYQFFDEKPHIKNFNTLILRSARDWSYVLFKDELCHSLVQSMNIDNMATCASVVFINGEYWGIHSFHERQDEYYIQQNYSYTSSNFDIIAYETDSGAYAAKGSIDTYNSLLLFLENHSLESDENYQKACSFIDVDNLIDFFIAQFYLANSDFPKKNLKLWREATADTSKFRYFFYDCDGCMIRTNYNHIDNYNNDIEHLQFFPDWSQLILQAFFQNRTFQQTFTQRFFYHLEHTFRTDMVIKKIEEFETLFMPLAAEHTLRWRLPENPRAWQANVNSLKLFAMQRPAVVYKELECNFESLFEIYPNPISKNEVCYVLFSGQSTKNEQLVVSIYSILGTKVHTVITTINQLATLNINSGLESGIYIVAFEYQGFTYIKTLFVN
ncbi:MAG: CotH kinase family protein [Bacteroidales bacterium]|nr:CotH kinase family protein [Bacteroidales bacterium]